MKIGSNDPCPCGSGKKYKKCCLKKEDDIIKWYRNTLLPNLSRFYSHYYEDEKEKAYEYFWEDFCPEEIFNDYDLLYNNAIINFFDWFIYDWVIFRKNKDGLKEGKNILELYAEKEKNLSTFSLQYIENIKDAVISLYEVIDVFHGKGFLVKDLIQGGKYRVSEKKVSFEIVERLVFGARLLKLDENYFMSGCIYGYEHDQKEMIIEEVHDLGFLYEDISPQDRIKVVLKEHSEIFNQFWLDNFFEPIPTLYDMNEELFLMPQAVFDLKDKASAISVLKNLKEFTQESENSFLLEDNENKEDRLLGTIEIHDNELILKTDSVETLEKGKSLIKKYLTFLVTHKKDILDKTFQMLESIDEEEFMDDEIEDKDDYDNIQLSLFD